VNVGFHGPETWRLLPEGRARRRMLLCWGDSKPRRIGESAGRCNRCAAFSALAAALCAVAVAASRPWAAASCRSGQAAPTCCRGSFWGSVSRSERIRTLRSASEPTGQAQTGALGGRVRSWGRQGTSGSGSGQASGSGLAIQHPATQRGNAWMQAPRLALF